MKEVISMSMVCIGLVNPKNPVNVGAILRASGCYDVSEILYTGTRYTRAAQYDKGHSRATHLDTNNAAKNIMLDQVDDLIEEAKARRMTTVCVELVEGAVDLPSFEHPDDAMYIFGPEDGSVNKQIVKACDHVVYIPTKGCLNLSQTANVVLYDRLAKKNDVLDSEQATALIRKSRDRNNRLKV